MASDKGSFGAAFKAARAKAKDAGKDPSKATFTWNGKTYHTRTAEEEARAKPAPGSRQSPFKADAKEDITVTAKKAPAMARAKNTEERFKATQRRVEGESVLDRVLRQNREMASYKKGGSIDGCAIRGKTRAGRK